ncbi:molybdate ABC transporter substrate-binding protein [Methanocella sp. CWC-04]|uniref:Molybdate ABC transporter substrate-binding protein n=1 Tax=Methanooceanicella nereidis TaxID=2052831 RepID=A0AAP2RF48_9EURY|nr:molybdate ABC transporter substrate-binding protein [Methanocella sp. CWC-04]MCD1296229.1 molybdate ABC transporter substrate-binding protein [Methanocella sp. CWC-04]
MRSGGKFILVSAVLLILAASILMAGCTTEQKNLNVYAGAGLKKPMDTVIAKYSKEKGINITPNYGPSGGLYSQIKEGQPCDVYVSADWLYIEKLENESMLSDSQKFLNENVVLVVSETGEKKGIKTASDLTKDNIVVAVCDPNAPVGKYSENVLKSLGLWDQLNEKGNIKARPSTVNQVGLMVQNDEVDAGFLYGSTALLYNLTYKEKYPNSLSGEIIFGIGLIKGDKEDVSRDFMNYLIENSDEFTKYGWEKYA